jgi:hypothetical protein
MRENPHAGKDFIYRGAASPHGDLQVFLKWALLMESAHICYICRRGRAQ